MRGMNPLRAMTDAATAASLLVVLAHCGARAELDDSASSVDASSEVTRPAPPTGRKPDAAATECPGTGTVAAVACATEAGADGESDAAGDGPPVTASGPFPCGPITCVSTEYCADHVPNNPGGASGGPPDTYICNPIPLACTQTPTCACIEQTIALSDGCSPQTPGVKCSADGAGHVTMRCNGL
jgi:hypothetical protein